MALPSTDASPVIASNARVVFNLFSLEGLLIHVVGVTPAGVVQKETGRSRSTVENWFKTNAFGKILTAIGNALPERAREAFHRYVTGQVPYPSTLGGYLYAQMGDAWADYRTCLKQFHNAEVLELSNREHFPSHDEAPLIRAILDAEDVCPSVPPQQLRGEPRTVTAGRLQELESDWERVVAVAFFHQLAALDLDACQSNFPGLQLKMLLPVVFPSRRKGLTGALYSAPELKLMELAYCLVNEKFDPPTLNSMLACLDPDLETTYRGKHRRGTFRLNDYYFLARYWWQGREAGTDIPESSELDEQRHDAFMAVLYLTAKVCSFLFNDEQDEQRLDAVILRFLSNYRAVWQFQAGVRGIDLSVGTPWSGSHTQELLARRVSALEEALAG